MSDYGLFIDQSLIDMNLTIGDIAADEGLETAVLISLFSDARATSDMLHIEDRDGDLRGFWGDLNTQDNTGSLLWTIKRAKQLSKTLAEAREYCQRALSWMVEDKVADRVVVTTEYPQRGWMAIQVDIYRTRSNNPVTYRYNYEWAAQIIKVAR